jgi:hypothetical protein
LARRRAKKSPFGRDSRREILQKHFSEHPVHILRAWEFVYRELLWVDGSTGLAHLYESDKAQPGRSAWYDRAVRFTDRLCHEFGNVSRAELKAQIDSLFKEVLQRLIEDPAADVERAEISQAVADEPGELLPAAVVEEAQEVAAEVPAYVPDADLIAEFAPIIAQRTTLNQQAAVALARDLVSKARYYFNVGKKRQNVLGQGFEDLLELLIARLTTVPADRIALRKTADVLPGFQRRGQRERIESPDLAIVVNGETRLLASFKWSLRQDRQKQLSEELGCYVELLSQPTFPRYVLITNEYDPGRLVNASALNRHGQGIACLYHVQPEFLREVLADGQKFQSDLEPLVQSGRLKSIADFLTDLNAAFGSGVSVQPLTPDQRRQQRRRRG